MLQHATCYNYSRILDMLEYLRQRSMESFTNIVIQKLSIWRNIKQYILMAPKLNISQHPIICLVLCGELTWSIFLKKECYTENEGYSGSNQGYTADTKTYNLKTEAFLFLPLWRQPPLLTIIYLTW